MMSQRRIQCDPSEVSFTDVESHKSYTKRITLTNLTSHPLSVNLKPCPTLDRDYDLSPSEISLSPHGSASISLSLKISKPGSYRDVIHLTTPLFSEKLYISIHPFAPLNSHFQSLVKDKEEQLQSSQSRIDRLEEEVEELSEKLRVANIVISEKARVEQELVRIQQENSELRAAIEEFKRNEEYHKQFKELMKENIPSLESLIELTLRQEREKNERKNEKVLEILQIKDSLIEDLEDKCEELNQALVLMQHKINDNKVLLSNTEKSLQGTQKTIEDLKTANFEKDQTISAYKNKTGILTPGMPQEDSGVLKNELLKNFDHIKVLTETIQKYEQENSRLREREEYVLELSNRHSKVKEEQERSIKDKESIITELKAKVNTQSEHIESLVLKLSQMNYSDVLNKVSKLEEENKNLSRMLADSQRSSQTFKKEDLDDVGVQRIVELEAENERLSISIQEISSKRHDLEAIVSEKNREIISLQNEIIDNKKARSEMALKAAPSPEGDIMKLTSSLKEEQVRSLKLEEENYSLKGVVKSLEKSNRLLSSDFISIFECLDSGEYGKSENELVRKINNKIAGLRVKEQEALKAAAAAEEGLRMLQEEIANESRSDSSKEIRKLQNEVMQAKSKNDLLTISNMKLKEELEEKKQIIINLQFLTAPEDKTVKKPKKRTRLPNKLIKALISAKIGEAEACKKLKQATKYEIDLREALIKKEDSIKSLEKELRLLKNSQSSESSHDPSAFDREIHKKLLSLESELTELRENELHSWASYSPLSLLWRESSSKPSEDFEIVLDGFLYLVDQLAYQDSNDSSETIEKSQRIVIRSLIKSINNSEEKMRQVLTFKPSREEDQKIWYVELLSPYVKDTVKLIEVLEEANGKINVEAHGTLAAASVKGVTIELMKCGKNVIEELNIVQQLCRLIRNDCETIVGREKLKGFHKAVEAEVKEGMKESAAEVAELKKINEKLQRELIDVQSKFEPFVAEFKSQQQTLAQSKSRLKQIQTEKEELQRGVEALLAELKEVTSLKDQALVRVEKVHLEMQDWQAAQVEVLTCRERTILDLQNQIKSMRDAKISNIPDSFSHQRLPSDTEDLKIDLKEIQALQEVNETLEKKIFELNEANNKERSQLISRIAVLEEDSKYIEKSEEFKGNQCSTLKKDPSIQLTSLQVLLREKISLLDDEMRRRIEAESKLRSVLLTESLAEQKIESIQKELWEKIRGLEDEVVQYEENLKAAFEDKEEIMQKYSQLTASLKETTENLKKAERELLAVQQEHKTDAVKFTTKLQSTANSSVELKGKVKDLTIISESLQKENEALHVHLKSLEKEFEVTSIRLEDSEKINTALKTKLKEYEEKIIDLEEVVQLECSGNSSRIQNIQDELKTAYEEFEQTIDQYNYQLTSLKEQFVSELKSKKNLKKAAETIDFMLQLSKKDAIIKSLKTELKSIKPKKLEKKPKPLKSPQKEEEITILQSQNYKLKSQLRSLEIQLTVCKEELDKATQERPPSEQSSRKDIVDIERRHRSDMQKLAEEVARLREKWHSPDEWNQLLLSNRELEATVKKLNDEIIRKKEIVGSLKAIKDQQDYENNAIQEELEQVKDSTEKVRKLRVELSRKEKVVCEMKATIEGFRENEKKLLDENSQMAEKIKGFKADVNRKEALIRELKAKIEGFGAESAKSLGEEVEKMKEKIKRLKGDCERKDLQLKTTKAKLETAEIELETLHTEKQNASIDVFTNLERELRKNEKLQAQTKRLESQFHSLCSITRKIFKELSDSVDFLKSKAGQNIDTEYYSDCMDILNMDMKDLSEFVGNRSIGTNLCRIERLLEQGEDTGEIVDIFKKLLDERLELEKSSMPSRKIEEKSTGKGSLSKFKSYKN